MRLGDCITTVRGVSYKRGDLHQSLDESSVVLLRANNISDGVINHDDVQYVDLNRVKDQQFLQKGDILICASSGSRKLVGKAAMVKSDAREVFGAFCIVIRPNDSINSAYLSHYFQSLQYRNAIERMCTGSNINNLKPAHFKELDVAIPDLRVQESAAMRLDGVQRLIDEWHELKNKLDNLVKSRFVEMFGEPEANQKGWRIVPLGDVLSRNPQNGLYKPQKCYTDDDKGTPIVRIDSFCDKGPDIPSLRRLTCLPDELERYGLTVGDVLINRVNSPGNMGKTMGVYYLSESVVFESNMMRMHPDESLVDTHYLVAYMTTSFGKRHFESRAKKAVNQASINQGDVLSLPLMMPPLELQNEYQAFVAQVDKSEFAVRRSIEQLELLKAKLMQEYFS